MEDSGGAVEGGSGTASVVLEFPAAEGRPGRVPKSIRQRMEERRSGAPRRSAEAIDAKLRDANLRRQAKRQRAQYLRHRGIPPAVTHTYWNIHQEHLSKILARCWRRFVISRKTILALSRTYKALGINENNVKAMPFDQLALLMQSATTLQTVKTFLERLESRLLLSKECNNSCAADNLDHLLDWIATPNGKTPGSKTFRHIKEGHGHAEMKSSRYPERVVLCAYMIISHPAAVFSTRGELETALTESALIFVRELELLIKIILDGSQSSNMSRLSQPDIISVDGKNIKDSSDHFSQKKTFRNQLEVYDKAWASYFSRFVEWKGKDATYLAGDLIAAACKLELYMMRTCKLTYEGQKRYFPEHMKAIQKQVTEEQQYLRKKIHHLNGDAGVERMDSALSVTRSKFFEGKVNGSPSMDFATHITSPEASGDSSHSLNSNMEYHPTVDSIKPSSKVVDSLFGRVSSPLFPKFEDQVVNISSDTKGLQISEENELLANEIIHTGGTNYSNVNGDAVDRSIKINIKEVLEKAFWVGLLDSLKGDKTDYSRIVKLVKEVRDELHGMVPQSLKQDLLANIDLDILSKVLESADTCDLDYLGSVLEYALSILHKLSAPAKETEMRKAHEKLLCELASIGPSDDKSCQVTIVTVIKGLRFVLEQIQTLKSEISKARIEMLEPVIKGPAGFEYLQKAFATRYGPPTNAVSSLPLTIQWISSERSNSDDEWRDHNDMLSAMSIDCGLPPVEALRSGCGGRLMTNNSVTHSSFISVGEEQPPCIGEKMDIIVRLGLLKLVNQVEGLTAERVPETLKLNWSRLRSIQSRIQCLLVIATGMLVLRQILLDVESGLSPAKVGSIISDAAKRLSEQLNGFPDAGLVDIIEMIGVSVPDAVFREKRELMARLLAKSLQHDNPVFKKVSRSVYLAARGLVLGGSGVNGKRLAQSVLQLIGAPVLLDQLVKAAEVLVIIARVSTHVHGPWYSVLL